MFLDANCTIFIETKPNKFDSGISNKLRKYREDANDLNKPGRFCIVSEIPESRKQ